MFIKTGRTNQGIDCQRQKIAAIKLYRETTGVGLKEAKDAVEAMSAATGECLTPFDQRNDAMLENQIKQLLKERQKIQAVKIYREAYNCGLKDAKDAVDIIEADAQGSAHKPAVYTCHQRDPFAEDTSATAGSWFLFS